MMSSLILWFLFQLPHPVIPDIHVAWVRNSSTHAKDKKKSLIVSHATDHYMYDITEILLKVALNPITLTPTYVTCTCSKHMLYFKLQPSSTEFDPVKHK